MLIFQAPFCLLLINCSQFSQATYSILNTQTTLYIVFGDFTSTN